ncbi:stellacyanin-like [Cucurbita maxima]|uniref:Stellacyanin-like n=1 Tax=Cucurbita maxima TaxID=3661 RepID=A0A6J1J846_CUCMA|nr:stellacyanin-like [Cucurbita maxima]
MDKFMMIMTITTMMMMMGSSVNAFTHIVGASHGWRVPDNVTFYDEWAKPRTFGVGDKLVFPYRPGANNIVAVKKTDYEVCGEENVINMYYLGPTILNLTEAGDYYYFDGIGKHCEAGQKLHVQVGSKEGTSGADPLPFNLETFGIHTNLDPTQNVGPAAAPTAATKGSNANVNANANALLVPAGLAAIAMFFSTFL